jgi:hypothetical protein
MIAGGAFLAGLTFWGKQTAGIYLVLAAITCLVLPAAPNQGRAWRLRWFAIGALASVAFILVFVASVGSLRGMWLWYFRYNLEYYRFHGIRKKVDILAETLGRDGYVNAAIVLASGLAAIGARALPLRALAFAIAPALEVASAVAQLRGWRYHYIPADFCTATFFLLALSYAWGVEGSDERRAGLPRIAAVGGFAFVAWWSMTNLTDSGWMKEGESHETDRSALDPMDAGKIIEEHTYPGDRVYHFGDDPAVLFFAKRRQATPYEVAWMLDLMRHVPLDGDLKITDAQKAQVLALQDQFEKDDCARVLHDPPPAFAFHDNATNYSGSVADVVYGYCPDLRPIIEKRYHHMTSGPYQLYFRDDRP